MISFFTFYPETFILMHSFTGKLFRGNSLIHFLPIFPFYTPQKTPENKRIFWCFQRGGKMGTLACNELISLVFENTAKNFKK